MDERLKRLIIRKAIKLEINRNGALMRYDGRLYYVKVDTDEVFPQSEYKNR
jgi:hypothetical protein